MQKIKLKPYHVLRSEFLNKREVSKQTKIKVYETVVVLTLTYRSGSWLLTDRIKSKIIAMDVQILRKIEGVFRFGKIRNEIIRESLDNVPAHICGKIFAIIFKSDAFRDHGINIIPGLLNYYCTNHVLSFQCRLPNCPSSYKLHSGRNMRGVSKKICQRIPVYCIAVEIGIIISWTAPIHLEINSTTSCYLDIFHVILSP